MSRATALLLASIAVAAGVLLVVVRSLVAPPTADPGAGASSAMDPEPVRVAQAPPGPEIRPSAAPAGEQVGRAADTGDGNGLWVTRNNDSAILLEDGELEKACEGFRRCHEAVPENDIFRRNLAEALARLSRELYKEDRIDEAIAALEEVLELSPEREDAASMRELLKRWRTQSAVEENHWSEGSDLFTLSFDTDRRDLLRSSQDVLDHLERSYEELRLYFAADPVREMGRRPIRVVLYDSNEFDRVTGLGDWAGGLFDGTVRVSVDDLRRGNWRPTLKHELVHAFLHELGGRSVPGWLNEGLAQMLEGRPGDLERARSRLRNAGSLFPLDSLQGSLASWQDTDAIARAYAQSLAFAHYLRRHYGDDALRRMILASGQGAGVGAAFEEWTAVPLGFAFDAFAEGLVPR